MGNAPEKPAREREEVLGRLLDALSNHVTIFGYELVFADKDAALALLSAHDAATEEGILARIEAKAVEMERAQMEYVAFELRQAIRSLRSPSPAPAPKHPWPATADDPDEIQSGKYDAPAPSLPATEGERKELEAALTKIDMALQWAMAASWTPPEQFVGTWGEATLKNQRRLANEALDALAALRSKVGRNG